MSMGIIGRKIGMTRIFEESGNSLPVTVVEVANNRIVRFKTEAADQYNAVVVAYGDQKSSRLNKPDAGLFIKQGVSAAQGVAEFRVDGLEAFEQGQFIGADLFEVGQDVDVTGVSKGKGFQGGIKRHNFSSQDATHGNSVSHRAIGSTGQNQSPGKVFKGKKMPGQMGNKRSTTQNLKVVGVDVERNLVLIRGAVPGHSGANVIVKPAVKQ